MVYEELAGDVHPGTLVLIDDGDIRLVVSRREADGVRAKVVSGGVALSRKGVNLPGVAVSAPSLTEKDREDLKFAVELGVDWIALSFVRRPEDVHAARGAVAAFGGEAPIIAKLERPEAIDHLAAIVAATDGVDGRARRPGRGDRPGAGARRSRSRSSPRPTPRAGR